MYLIKEQWIEKLCFLYLPSGLFFLLPQVISLVPWLPYDYPKIVLFQLTVGVSLVLFWIFLARYVDWITVIKTHWIWFGIPIAIIASLLGSKHLQTSLFGYLEADYLYSSLHLLSWWLWSMGLLGWQGVRNSPGRWPALSFEKRGGRFIPSFQKRDRQRSQPGSSYTHDSMPSKISSHIEALLFWMVLGSLLVGLDGLVRIVTNWDALFQDFRLRGPLGEPNRMGFYLVVLIPLQSYFLSHKKKLYLWVGGMSLGLSLTGLVFTYTRGAWLLIGGLGLLSVWLFGRSIFTKRTLVIGTLVVLVLFVTPVGQRIYQRSYSVVSDLEQNRGSVSVRLDEWNTSFRILSQFNLKEYLIGLGPNMPRYAFFQYQMPNLGVAEDQRSWTTHVVRNHYLEVLLSQGLLGLLAWLSLIGLTAWRYLRTRKKDLKWHPVFLSWLGLNAVGLLYYWPLVLWPFWWLETVWLWRLGERKDLGIRGEGLGRIPKDQLSIIKNVKNKTVREKKPFNHLTIGPLTSVSFKRSYVNLNNLIIVLAVIVSLSFLLLTSLYTLADVLSFMKKAERSMDLVPWEARYVRSAISKRLQASKDKPDPKRLEEARQLAERLLQLNGLEPNNYSLAFRANFFSSVWLKKSDWLEPSLELAKQQVVVNPNWPSSWDDQGQIYLHLKRFTQAEEAFSCAVSLDPDYYHSWMHLGETAKQQGQLNQAIYYYQEAIRRNPYGADFFNREIEKVQELQLDKK